jgi:cobalt-zinc-cadmium efflux system outer membrane protein
MSIKGLARPVVARPLLRQPSAMRRFCGTAGVACILPLAVVASARAEDAIPSEPALSGTLSLQQALDIFHARGLDLLIAEAMVQNAEGDLGVAGAIPNPAASFGVGYSVCPGPNCVPSPPWPPLFTAGLSDSNALEDFLSGKRGLRVDVAQRALDAAKLSRADAERTIAFQVKSQFETALLARDALKFAREVAEANAKMLDLMETRNRAGAVSDADVLRVKVAKLEADQAVNQADQSARANKAGLAFLLGVRSHVAQFDVDQPELAQYTPPSQLEKASRDSLLAEALQRRPDVLSQRAQVQSADSALALARRQRLPDIAVNLGYTQQGTTPSAITPPTFSVGLSSPLPIFYQQQGEIRKAEAALRTQQLQEAKLEAQVVNDLETAYVGFVAAQALVQRMEAGTLLASARRARDLVFIQYQKGAASLLDYLTAQQTFTATMVEYLTDLTNYWTAVFGVEKAVGKELR